MPDILTPKDIKLLDRLAAAKNGVFSGGTVRELVDITQRLQLALSTSEIELATARHKYTCIAVAAYGLDTAEGIAAKGLPAELQAECLALRQMHDDARAWREMSAAETETAPTDGR